MSTGKCQDQVPTMWRTQMALFCWVNSATPRRLLSGSNKMLYVILDNFLLSLSPYLPPSVNLSVWLSVCLFICLCSRPSLHVSLCTSASCCSVDLSVYLSFRFTLPPSLTYFIYWWRNTPVFKKTSRILISRKNTVFWKNVSLKSRLSTFMSNYK